MIQVHVEPVRLLVSAAVAALLIKITSSIASRVRDHLEEQGLKDVGWWAEKGLKYASYIVGALVILQGLGVGISALVAGLGLAGAGVAVAARDAVADVVYGLMIAVERPFEVGEVVRVKGLQGEVEDIGLRSTVLRTSTGRIVLPNSVVAGEPLEVIEEAENELEVVIRGTREDVERVLSALSEMGTVKVVEVSSGEMRVKLKTGEDPGEVLRAVHEEAWRDGPRDEG